MLKTYVTCPKKYEYKYLQHFSLPTRFEIFEKGKKIHALACYYLRKEDITELEKALSQEEAVLWQRLKNNEYFNLNVYSTEYELNCKLNNHWIGGRLDAVVFDDYKNFFILDYKTGAIPQNPQEDMQTLVYLQALATHLKNQYHSIKFVYIDLKNNQNVIINYDYEKCRKINNVLSKIEMDIYPQTTDKNLCSLCEYKSVCN